VPVVTAEILKLDVWPWSTVLAEVEVVGAAKAELRVTDATVEFTDALEVSVT
jgi:hypothetical protein